MGDIDQALARAYARRGPVGDAPTTPAPHFPVAGPPIEPALLAEARRAAFVEPELVASLEWPPTVRALERQHGPRFEQLADALVSARVLSQVRSIFFTSCHRSEGRTTLVLGLARALARRPGRTVLVDADLSGPMLARSLGLRPRYGLDDVLDGSASIAGRGDRGAGRLIWPCFPLRAAPARPRESLAGRLGLGDDAWPGSGATSTTSWSTAGRFVRRPQRRCGLPACRRRGDPGPQPQTHRRSRRAQGSRSP